MISLYLFKGFCLDVHRLITISLSLFLSLTLSLSLSLTHSICRSVYVTVHITCYICDSASLPSCVCQSLSLTSHTKHTHILSHYVPWFGFRYYPSDTYHLFNGKVCWLLHIFVSLITNKFISYQRVWADYHIWCLECKISCTFNYQKESKNSFNQVEIIKQCIYFIWSTVTRVV